MTLEQPRIIRGPPRNLTVVIGGTIRIECEATGFPAPFINWRLNWGHVCEEPRCFSTTENGKGVLTVTDARYTDAGAYSCEALNSKGRVFAIPDAIVTVVDGMFIKFICFFLLFISFYIKLHLIFNQLNFFFCFLFCFRRLWTQTN
jgi:hypothetical protein